MKKQSAKSWITSEKFYPDFDAKKPSAVNRIPMRLSELKNLLTAMESITFRLENGSYIPPHFHVTEIGVITRNYIDCGGIIRFEKSVNFQLWYSNDYLHRLKPAKLMQIIGKFEQQFYGEDAEIEAEYQGETIGKYRLDFDGVNFLFLNKKTTCLALDNCGIPDEKEKVEIRFAGIPSSHNSCCSPESGCC